MPSFVVTLAGLLIWQGVILKILELRGVIIIETNWINDAATYYFSANVGWLIAAIITGLYALVELGSAIGQRRAGLSLSPWIPIAKLVGVAVACFGTVAICNHATRPAACAPGTPLTVSCTQPIGLPLAALLMVVFLVGLTFLAKRTTFGRHVYAVGGNAEAARRAGINVARIRILVFMISGVMAGVGGIVLAARLQSVNLQQGGGTLLLDSISAAVIGGVSLFGGRGEVRGALLGSLVIATVANGLNIGGYSTGAIYVVTGVILLLAVTLDSVARRLQERSGRSGVRHVDDPVGGKVLADDLATVGEADAEFPHALHARRGRSARADPRTRDSSSPPAPRGRACGRRRASRSRPRPARTCAAAPRASAASARRSGAA